MGGPEYPHIKETASQTYKVGDLLYGDSSGTIAIATVDGGTPTLLNGEVAGQAIKDASGTTGQNVLFRRIRSEDLFFFSVHHQTEASAITAQADLFDVLGLCKSTLGVGGATVAASWRISKDAAGESATLANGDVRVLGIPLRHPIGGALLTIGDTFGLLLAKFNVISAASDGNPFRRVLQLG